MWLDELSVGLVDSTSRTPLHRQLSAIIRARIADRTLPPGSQLPTEAQVQERFGISRSVVRQAFSALTSEGLIQRGRGRGSVVAPQGEHHRLVQRMPGLSTQIAAQGARVTTEILALGQERNPRAEAALGVPEVLAVRRLRSVANEPIALIHTWLPLPLSATLTAEELTNASLHAVMRKKYGVSILSGRRQVRAVSATVSVAEALSIDIGMPVLLLEGSSLDEHGLPVEMFSTWHRADRIVFDIDVLGEGEPTQRPESPSSDTTDRFNEFADTELAVNSAETDVVELARRARILARQLHELSDDLDRDGLRSVINHPSS